MFKNILIVCVGNICRSPALERLLAEKLPNRKVHSAGLGALVGKPIESTMQALMVADGVNANDHAARKIDSKLIAEADLILVMEKKHIRTIREHSPEASGKTMLASQWLDQVDVADPYRKDLAFFEACYLHLKSCADTWVSKLA